MAKRPLTLIIKWRYGDEYLVIPAELLDKGGAATFRTHDYDKDGSSSEYIVRARCRRKGPQQSVLDIVYDSEQNRLPTGKDRRNLEWGTLTVVFIGSKPEEYAKWQVEGEKACTRQRVTAPAANLTGRAKRRLTEVLQRSGQSTAREQLLLRYKVCMLTGESTADALEASHIVGATAGGIFDIGNGLLLRADLHRLFDAGFFDIDPQGHVRLSPEKQDNLSSTYRRILEKAPPLKSDVLGLCGKALSLRARRKAVKAAKLARASKRLRPAQRS